MTLRSKSNSIPFKPLALVLLALGFFAFDEAPLLAQSTELAAKKYLAQKGNSDESVDDNAEPSAAKRNPRISDEDLQRLKKFRERRRMMQNAGAGDNPAGASGSSAGASSEDPDMPGFRMRKKGTAAGAGSGQDERPRLRWRDAGVQGGPDGPGPVGQGPDDMPPGRGRRGFNGEGFGGTGGPNGPDDMPGGRGRRGFNGNGFGGPGGPGGPGGDDMPPRGRRNLNPDSNSEDMPGPGMRGDPDGEGMQMRKRLGGFSEAGIPQGFPGARGPGGGRRQGQGGAFGGHPLDLTPLALTAEQKQKVQEMRAQTKLKVKNLRKSVSQNEAKLRELMFNPDASEAQIRAARKELRKQQDLVDEANMNDLLGIRSMLTPDQKKRLPDCMPGRNNTANGGMGPYGQPPGPPGLPPKGPAPLPPAPPPPGFAASAEGAESGSSVSINKKRRAPANRRSLEAESNGASK